jgi:hypothetical protein
MTLKKRKRGRERESEGNVEATSKSQRLFYALTIMLSDQRK